MFFVLCVLFSFCVNLTLSVDSRCGIAVNRKGEVTKVGLPSGTNTNFMQLPVTSYNGAAVDRSKLIYYTISHNNGDLYKIDICKETFTKIASGVLTAAAGLAFNKNDGYLYGIPNSPSTNVPVSKINPNDGSSTVVGNLETNLQSMLFDRNDLDIIAYDGISPGPQGHGFFKFALNTAPNFQLIKEFGGPDINIQAMDYEYASDDNKFIATAPGTSNIYEIDRSAKTITTIGNINPFVDTFGGLSIFYTSCDNICNSGNDYNPINRMDQRIRAIERHFYPEPTPVSILLDYYKEYGETILTLDEFLRKLINGKNNGNDVRGAVEHYFVPETEKRNSLTVIGMDKAIFKLQTDITSLEGKVTILENNDWDSELFLLIKQIQCELSQIAEGKAKDCRIRSCKADNDIDGMINDLSPVKKICPVGFDEVDVVSSAHLVPNNFDNFDNFNTIHNINSNHHNYIKQNFDDLLKQIYILYAIIGFLVMMNIAVFGCLFYPQKTKRKVVYDIVQNKDEMEIINH